MSSFHGQNSCHSDGEKKEERHRKRHVVIKVCGITLISKDTPAQIYVYATSTLPYRRSIFSLLLLLLESKIGPKMWIFLPMGLAQKVGDKT